MSSKNKTRIKLTSRPTAIDINSVGLKTKGNNNTGNTEDSNQETNRQHTNRELLRGNQKNPDHSKHSNENKND